MAVELISDYIQRRQEVIRVSDLQDLNIILGFFRKMGKILDQIGHNNSSDVSVSPGSAGFYSKIDM